MTEKGEYRMNFFMGKKFVGPGGGKKDQGPEVVFDNGEESNKRMKRMLRPIKIAIAVAVLAIAAFDSFYTLSENEMAVLTTFGRPSSVTTSGPKFKVPFIQKIPYNVHFKKPFAPTYMEQLKQMEADGMVSLRGLRKDAT